MQSAAIVQLQQTKPNKSDTFCTPRWSTDCVLVQSLDTTTSSISVERPDYQVYMSTEFTVSVKAIKLECKLNIQTSTCGNLVHTNLYLRLRGTASQESSRPLSGPCQRSSDRDILWQMIGRAPHSLAHCPSSWDHI